MEEDIKELNIPVETLIAEFNRLEDLEDDREQLNDYIKDLQKKLTNDFVSKDKIRARIEELQAMYNELPKNPKEHLHSKTEYKIVIGELQELLEERS